MSIVNQAIGVHLIECPLENPLLGKLLNDLKSPVSERCPIFNIGQPCLALNDQVGYTDVCTSPQMGEGYGVLQETFDGTQFYHASSAYYTAGTVSSLAQESFFPFGVPTSGEHCTACSLVGDPGFAFAVFYWWAYSEASNLSACEIVNLYDGEYGQSAQQYAYAKGITPCATSSACGVSEGTCSYID